MIHKSNDVSGFPVVGFGGEAGRDYDTGLILVNYKAVGHLSPP